MKNQYGSVWERIGAKVIDSSLCFMIGSIPLMQIYAMLKGVSFTDLFRPENTVNMSFFSLNNIFLVVIPVIIDICYKTFFHGKYGQTVGKMICKIKVVSINNKPISYLIAFFRAIVVASGVIPIIGSIFTGFDFIFMVVRKDRRSLHDLVAGTKVIKLATAND